MNTSDNTVVIAVAAVVQAAAALVNLAIVFWLVRVTKRYVDETADIAAGTQVAATAAQRSAEAAERQILLTVRPTLHISPALNFSVHNRRFLTGEDNTQDLVPCALSVQICNDGPGRAFAVQPRMMIEGISYNIDGFRPEGSIGPGEWAQIHAKAEDADLVPLLGQSSLSGSIVVTFRDAAGSEWQIEWPFNTRGDPTSAIVQGQRLTRIATTD